MNSGERGSTRTVFRQPGSPLNSSTPKPIRQRSAPVLSGTRHPAPVRPGRVIMASPFNLNLRPTPQGIRIAHGQLTSLQGHLYHVTDQQGRFYAIKPPDQRDLFTVVRRPSLSVVNYRHVKSANPYNIRVNIPPPMPPRFHQGQDLLSYAMHQAEIPHSSPVIPNFMHGNGLIPIAPMGGGRQTHLPRQEGPIQILDDYGKGRLFPLEPVLNTEFKDYVHTLSTQNPEEIKKLSGNPPITLKSRRRQAIGGQEESHCYVTVEDLNQVLSEVTRIKNSWSEEEQDKLNTNPESMFKLFNLHEYLMSHIVKAKSRCIWAAISKCHRGDNAEDLSIPDRYDKFGHSLQWQEPVFVDLHRQGLSTICTIKKEGSRRPRPQARSPKRKRAVASTGDTPNKNNRKRNKSPQVNNESETEINSQHEANTNIGTTTSY